MPTLFADRDFDWRTMPHIAVCKHAQFHNPTLFKHTVYLQHGCHNYCWQNDVTVTLRFLASTPNNDVHKFYRQADPLATSTEFTLHCMYLLHGVTKTHAPSPV